ncbi:MAG TPA: CobW family GTP-binding protein [Nocardia sp.]|uniref:CobW family GTP-binding protein n=1 Tax=Nocardia TaxID=1817 RepID=UPI0024550D06|nr:MULTISPECIES: GTP-binding protein [Nocardia]HLS77120.1 CobW family GTP-binding protein [Nocardia sp.]
MSERIPVLIVAGFLGSGKTTLLNRLLHDSGSTRIGVVVNDFGAVNIDAMLVAGQVDAMVSVGNGCVCCAVDVGELDTMFERLSEPQAGIDVIVVEASGLAEPRNLIRMVIGSENPRIHYGGLLEVVDAAEFPAARQRHPELATHLRLADLVVLNKADRVPPAEVERLREEIAALVAPSPVHVTSHGRVDPALLFDAPARERTPVAGQLSFDDLWRELEADRQASGCDDGAHDDHRHLHDDYTSVSFTSEHALDPRGLVGFLEDPPHGLFRAKGVTEFAVDGHQRTFGLHVVGRHIVFEPRPWRRGEDRVSSLVLIGAGLRADEALGRLEQTIHPGPDPLDDQALLGVWRYTPH